MNTNKKPNIEIRDLVIREGFSEETHCFYCRVYVNGEYFCGVKNDGHGGENDYNMSGEKAWDDALLLDQAIGKFYPPEFEASVDGEKFPIPADLDSVVTGLVYGQAAARAAERASVAELYSAEFDAAAAAMATIRERVEANVLSAFTNYADVAEMARNAKELREIADRLAGAGEHASENIVQGNS